MKQLLLHAEAAALLRISARHLRNLTSAGRIAVIRLGRSVRYHPDEIERYISERAEVPQ